MIPIGLGAVFAGYWISLWGYCLIRGYDVKFMGLARTTWPAGQSGSGGSGSGSGGSKADPALGGVQRRVGSSPAAQARGAAGQPPGGVAGRL